MKLVKMRSGWSKAGPNLMLGVLLRRKFRHNRGDGGRDGRDAATSYGRQSPQKLEEARKASPLQLSEGVQPCPHLDLGRLASRTMTE